MKPHWRFVGTSVAGPSHAAAGQPCQDSHRIKTTANGALIAVVSDGAGSALYGGEGAATICKRVIAHLEPALDWGLMCRSPFGQLASACRAVRDAVIDARMHLAMAAQDRGVGINHFHATLVGVALVPGRGGLSFHIGDGAALALADDWRWRLSAPANGEYADTTYFFTEPDWRTHLRFARIDPGFETVFVMTDGVTDIALQRRGGASEPHRPFFEPIARFLADASSEDGERALHATLDSPAVRSRTTDDKTLVWASMRAG
ncbi:PP2C family serine/threonine-protein phosphatase [Sphingomonas sp. ST-64]|uniref:PP2C family serine/threonine-protein phosphatase n=1 Tax=Sphingomonas plantiphila TaxID=3163295 RepID=A0ABW8YQA0_9SPHN